MNAQGAQWDCRCIPVNAQGDQWDCTVSGNAPVVQREWLYVCMYKRCNHRLGCGFVLLCFIFYNPYSIFYLVYTICYIVYFINRIFLLIVYYISNTLVSDCKCRADGWRASNIQGGVRWFDAMPAGTMPT